MSDKRFATFFNKKQNKDAKASGSGSESEDEQKKRQAFYVGGSEKSGQQVLGPPSVNANESDLVTQIFQSARGQGAEQPPQSSSSSGQPAPAASDGTPAARPTVPVVLRMWQNGFSLDDGELRDYNATENRNFLQNIIQRRIPMELVRQHAGAEIDLKIQDHREEAYKPPPMKAFSGEGRRLGGMASPVNLEQTPPPTAPVAPKEKTVEQGQSYLKIDPSKPTTSVKVRMAKRKPMVIKCNHDHTVTDIRKAVCDAHPDSSSVDWCLMTTFPNREINDESITVAAAGLLNVVVIQKIKPNTVII